MRPNASASPAWARSTRLHTSVAGSDGSGRLGYPVEVTTGAGVEVTAGSTAVSVIDSSTAMVGRAGDATRPPIGLELPPGVAGRGGGSLWCAGRFRMRLDPSPRTTRLAVSSREL